MKTFILMNVGSTFPPFLLVAYFPWLLMKESVFFLFNIEFSCETPSLFLSRHTTQILRPSTLLNRRKALSTKRLNPSRHEV